MSAIELTDAGMHVTCLPYHFQCHENHRCIPKHLTCDGIEHCIDGSDELGCGTSMCYYSIVQLLRVCFVCFLYSSVFASCLLLNIRLFGWNQLLSVTTMSLS